jgi:hypothetical protein
MSENTCPNTACPVHFRNDYRETFEAGRATRIITYVGEHAVFTSDNPELFTSNGTMEAIKAALGLPANPPKLFTTSVVRVGENGNLGPFTEDPDGLVAATVFKSTHGVMPDEEVALKAGSLEGINQHVDAKLGDDHLMIVEQVRNGIIPSGV